jgi:hypothetical protein
MFSGFCFSALPNSIIITLYLLTRIYVIILAGNMITTLKPTFVLSQASRNVHVLSHMIKAGFEQWYLLSSDHHRDNPKCKDELVLKHLNQAKERNAGILMFGDYFCCMQGKYDKRADKSALRPEHQNSRYFDALVETETEFLAPYAENICMIGYGNHETSVLKRHETDLIQRLVSSINVTAKPEQPVYAGGYSGYVKFQFGREAGQRSSVLLKYRHSGGSMGEITKGTLGVDRMAKAYPDADIIVTGDNHEEWQMTLVQERVTASNKIIQREQLHIKTPTYKEEYEDGYMGWHVERNAPPKPLGAVWLRFFFEDGVIKYETIRAK